MGELEILEKDKLMSQRIENILRNVEGQVLVYLGHYGTLSENLSGQELFQDMKKIENCIPSLESATEIIIHEIKDFASIKNSIINRVGNNSEYKSIKSHLNVIQVHMNNTLPPLNAYIEGLKAIKINGNNAIQAKKSVMQKAGDIQSFYTKFVRENEAYIQGLQVLIEEISSKKLQYAEK